MALDKLNPEAVGMAAALLKVLADPVKTGALLGEIERDLAEFGNLNAQAADLQSAAEAQAKRAKDLDDREGAIASLEAGLAEREQRLADGCVALDERTAAFAKAEAEAAAGPAASEARAAAPLAEAKAALDAVAKREEEVTAREIAADLRESKLRAALG